MQIQRVENLRFNRLWFLTKCSKQHCEFQGNNYGNLEKILAARKNIGTKVMPIFDCSNESNSISRTVSETKEKENPKYLNGRRFEPQKNHLLGRNLHSKAMLVTSAFSGLHGYVSKSLIHIAYYSTTVDSVSLVHLSLNQLCIFATQAMRATILCLLLVSQLLIVLVSAGKSIADVRFCQHAANCAANFGAAVEAVQAPPPSHEVEMVPKTGSIAIDNSFCATSCEWFRAAVNVTKSNNSSNSNSNNTNTNNAAPSQQFCSDCSKRFIIYKSQDTGLNRCYDFSKDFTKDVFTIEFLNKVKDACGSQDGGVCSCTDKQIKSFDIDLLIVNIRKIAEESINNATKLVLQRQDKTIQQSNSQLENVRKMVEQKKEEVTGKMKETITGAVERLNGFVDRISTISKKMIKKLKKKKKRRRATKKWGKKIGQFRIKVNNAIEQRKQRVNEIATAQIARVQQASQEVIARVMERYNRFNAEVQVFLAQYHSLINANLQQQVSSIQDKSKQLTQSANQTKEQVDKMQNLDGYREFYNQKFEQFQSEFQSRTQELAGQVSQETTADLNSIMDHARSSQKSFEDLIEDLQRLDQELDKEAKDMEGKKKGKKNVRRAGRQLDRQAKGRGASRSGSARGGRFANIRSGKKGARTGGRNSGRGSKIANSRGGSKSRGGNKKSKSNRKNGKKSSGKKRRGGKKGKKTLPSCGALVKSTVRKMRRL